MGDEPIWFICSFARHVAFKSSKTRQPVPKTREIKFYISARFLSV